MRGDILLYFSDGSWPSRLITHFTRGPYSHVAVNMGDGTQIAAETSGVVRSPITQVKTLYIPVSVRAESPESQHDGLRFLEGEVGNHYGWIDIVNQALKVFGSTVFLGARDQYDCSDLAARYLCITRGPLYEALGEAAEEPHMVTPNDIARAAGLIDSNGRMTVKFIRERVASLTR
jgi:hypothetical protein